MVKVFNEGAKQTINGKEYSGAELNEFMTKIQDSGYNYTSEEERELYSCCWFLAESL